VLVAAFSTGSALDSFLSGAGFVALKPFTMNLHSELEKDGAPA